MNKQEPLFTIFTGLYNSSGVIHRIFQSVQHQTYRNFEWIIFDDASSDNTRELVDTFIAGIPEIEVKYFRNETNKGVSYGRWEALKMARGRYFVTWDHDDIQMPDQLETYVRLWDQYDADDMGAICGFLVNEDGVKIGRPFPSDVYISDYFGVYSKYLMGENKPGKLNERHLCNKTAKFREAMDYIMQQGIILPPELPNGSEVWGMMAVLGNKTIYINQVLRQYFIEPDRPSMTTIGREKGALRIYRDRRVWVNYFVQKLPPGDWKIKLRTYLSYCMYGSYCTFGIGKLLNDVKGLHRKLLVILFFIPGKLMHLRLERK